MPEVDWQKEMGLEKPGKGVWIVGIGPLLKRPSTAPSDEQNEENLEEEED